MREATIITVGLWGGNREAVAPDAARSALPFTDYFVFVDTGPSARAAIEATTALPELSGSWGVSRFPGEFRYCYEGRNFCLDAAAHQATMAGHDLRANNVWAFWIDTDERVELRGADVKAFLAETTADTVMVRMGSNDYPKAKFIRLPAAGHFIDRVHELYECGREIAEMPGIVVHELEKPHEEMVSRNLAIRRVCEQWISDEPWYGRAWMHLANTYLFADHINIPLAASLFRKAAELTTAPEHREHRAWMLFKAAGCLFALERYTEAYETAIDGMKHCAYFPELPYLAQAAAGRAGILFDALAWGVHAIGTGEHSPIPAVTPLRTKQRIPNHAWEGPWAIRAQILDAMPGLEELAEDARQMASDARKGREAAT